MQTEIHGRLMLTKKNTFWSIISKDKLEDSFDTLPRKVLHVGTPRYIQGIWNRMKRDNSWLKDAVRWK